MSAKGTWLVSITALTLAACGEPRQSAQTEHQAAQPGNAAFDACATNAALCANKDIAALSGQVTAALAEAASDVSAEGAKLLEENQQTWLEAQRTACGVAADAKQLTPAQQDCLKAAMAERAKDVAGAVEKKGPFTFQRIEVNQTATFEASAAGNDDGAAASRQIAYPRIDGDSPVIKKFNEAMKRSPRFRLDQKTEEQTRYQIGYAAEDLVSVRFDEYDFTSGAVGPNKAARAVSMNMKTGEPIAVADIFRPGAKWVDFLAQRVARDVTAALKNEDEMAVPVSPSEVRATVAKPGAWYVTDSALVVLLPPTAFARPMEVGPREVSIPWKDLKPYLSPSGLGPAKS